MDTHAGYRHEHFLQTQSMALLHMAVHIMPDLRIFFLDTGYHFWDTLIFREKIQHEWNLNVIDLYRDSAGYLRASEHTHASASRPKPVLLYSQSPADAKGIERIAGLDQRHSTQPNDRKFYVQKFWNCRMTAC